MRGDDYQQEGIFSYISFRRSVVPADHPLRPIRKMVDEDSEGGCHRSSRSCIPMWGAHRLRQSGCCGRCCCRSSIRVRSERMLIEQLQYNLLFRVVLWGWRWTRRVWNHAVFQQESGAFC